jgi:hypothetical protein
MFQYFDYNDILFRNLVAASPSIWWNGGLAFTRENALYAQTSVLPVNLYMTVGSYEGSMVTDMEQMQQILEGHEYEYFNASYHVNQGKDHTTNKEQTFREGIPWVLRQEIPMSTNSNVLAQSTIGKSIYPNPATEQVNIELLPKVHAQKINYRVIDLMGKEMKAEILKPASTDRLQFSVSGFPQGIYFVQLSDGNAHQNLKFVKH